VAIKAKNARLGRSFGISKILDAIVGKCPEETAE
jgi:hypothetical protein